MAIKIPVQYLYKKIVNLNILWAFFSPLLLALILTRYEYTWLFILKDLFFYFSFVLVFFIGKSKGLFNYILLIALFVFYLFTTTALFFEVQSWIFYSLRQLLSPILIFSFGYYLRINPESIKSVIHKLYKISFWVVILGLLFLIFNMWEYINLKIYFNLKGIPVDPSGVSYMFYEPALSYAQRMVSTVLDPISLGHMIATPLILCYYSVFISGRKRKLYLAIFLIGLLLTFSKGAILQVVLALFFFNKNLSKAVRYLIPLLFVILVLTVINIKGILIHLVGVKNAIVYLNVYGHGIGMVGNYAKMFADDLTVYHELHISDTFIGAVIGQIGLFGFILWLSFFLPKIKWKSLFSGHIIHVGSIVLITQLIISIISENTLNFTSFIIAGIISGILIRNSI